MTSELFREIAVLVAVFGWLDEAARERPFFAGTWPLLVLGSAAASFLAGVVLERRQTSASLRKARR